MTIHTTARCTNCVAVVTLPHAKARGVMCEGCWGKARAMRDEAKPRTARCDGASPWSAPAAKSELVGHEDAWSHLMAGGLVESTCGLMFKVEGGKVMNRHRAGIKAWCRVDDLIRCAADLELGTMYRLVPIGDR